MTQFVVLQSDCKKNRARARFCEIPSIYLRTHSTISAALLGGKNIARCDSEATIIAYISILFIHLNYFFPLYDKHFETDEKMYCGTDESITPFYNTIHRLI